MRRLVLRAVDGTGDAAWTWELLSGGARIATTRVELDSDWRREPFNDLSGHLSRYSVSGFGAAHLRELLDDLGTWITAKVLGPGLAAELAARPPTGVTVDLAPGLHRLLAAPLELAQVAGRSLASLGVTFGFRVGGGGPAHTTPPATKMLAVFPLPSDIAELGLRAERLALQSIAARAAAAHLPVSLTCLQYGVTRETLRELLAEEEFDVVHFGGHGARDGLVLADDTGARDLVTADELGSMLEPQRGRVRLLVLGACDTGANQAARLIGRLHDGAARDVPPPEPGTQGVAVRLARSLDTVVVAMRFAVDDSFARHYATAFYEGLLLEGRSVEEAYGNALRGARDSVHDDALGLLAEFTPVLYSPAGADLRIGAGAAPTAAPPTAGPAVFVGRADELRRMSVLLRPRGAVRSAVLTGGHGVGKTACADEFTDAARGLFERIVSVTLAEGDAPDVLEEPLGGWREAARTLRERRFLIVVDGIDRVMHDGRLPESWRKTVELLTGHGGASRAVLTSRLPVEGVDLTIGVGGLSATEVLLLAAELPRLGGVVQELADGEEELSALQTELTALVDGTDRSPGAMAVLDAVGADLGLKEALAELRRIARGDLNRGEPAWRPAVEAARWAARVTAGLDARERSLATLIAVSATLQEAITTAEIEEAWPQWWRVRDDGGDGEVPEFPAEGLLARGVAVETATGWQLVPFAGELLRAGGARSGRRRTLPEPTAPQEEPPPEVPEGSWDRYLPVSLELIEEGRSEEALRLLCTAVDAGVTSAGELRPFWIAARLWRPDDGGREGLLVALATALTTGSPLDRRARLADLYAQAADEPDISAFIGLFLLNLLLELHDHDAYDGLSSEVAAALEGAGRDRTYADRLGQLNARRLLALGDAEEALSRAGAIADTGEDGRRDLHPVAELTRARTLEEALETAMSACALLHRWDESLRYTDRLLLLRARRRAPLSAMTTPTLQKAQALAALGRLDEAEALLDGAQRIAATTDDVDGNYRAIVARTAVDALRGRFADMSRFHETSLAIGYAGDLDSLIIGNLHLQACAAHMAILFARVPETEQHHTPMEEDDAMLRFGFACAHLLAGVVLHGMSSPDLAARPLEEYGWLLDDLLDEVADPAEIDLAWIADRLPAPDGRRPPFLKLVRRSARTEERLAEAQNRLTEALSALRAESERASRERREDVEAARRELAPVFEAVIAAAGGDREARDALEELCELWDDDPEARPWAAAFRLLADRRDASALPGIVDERALLILVPLLKELRPPGLSLE
ncbi:CHAT domain-containing protein [Actinomadura sediminis]|uniref:CHAT domain-containing protein n=1 Tax=Actinomadura sediminis TaxID=1038904 RepID=A0ABW3EWL2_9ACTN